MFSSKQYRAKAAEYVELGSQAGTSKEISDLKTLEQSFTVLADNEEWLERNYKNLVHPADREKDGKALAASSTRPAPWARCSKQKHCGEISLDSCTSIRMMSGEG
jgi:hypothetical protein